MGEIIMAKQLRIVDTTLRDGMHSVAHQFTPEQMIPIAQAMDDAGIDVIEVSHGDGLGGSCLQYGRAAATDEEYLKAVAPVLKRSKLAVLLLPGVGTKDDLDMAADLGAKVARIATHVTEADISQQHIGLAKNRNLEVMCFLMMAHMAPIETMLQNAKLMESYGADYVYVVDSSGYMLPPEVKQRVSAMKTALQCGVGFHGHNNLGLAIGNTLAAIEAGVDLVDGSLRAFGAGGGNAPTETLVAVLTRLGVEIGADLYKTLDAAKIVDQYKRPGKDNIESALMLGYAGVYSSFLLHTARAAERFQVDARDILVELGRRRIVGGQEDMIIDVAYELANRK
jgi:4-hydroxy-2-oxovalerate aldolase